MTITIIAVPEFSEKKAYSEILNNLSHSPVRYLVCSSGYNKKSSEWFPDLDWAPVDILISSGEHESFLREYLEVIATFNQWNGKDLKWWATHFSSKNRFNSPVLPFLQQWFYCLRAIESHPEKSTLVLLGVSWEVIQGLKAIQSNHQWNVRVISVAFGYFRYRLLNKIKLWLKFLAKIVRAIESIRDTRKTFSLSTLTRENLSPVYLIKSFTYQRNFKQNGKYSDPFFGKLSEYLQQSFAGSPSVITVALGFQDKKECYSLMNTLNDVVHPLEAYLHYSDVLCRAVQWIYKLVFFPFKMKGRIQFMGYDTTCLFKELIRCGGFRISFSQALHYDIAKRLGKKYLIQVCLMTYEGRPWERFFMAGLRKANLNTRIIGYQHTVVPISATDMFLYPKEKDVIPLPNKIILTGLIPKKILEQYSSYPKEQLYVGCALRFEYLQGLSFLKYPRISECNNFVLLVAFVGSSEEVPLLNYALEQASLNVNLILRMRTHPAFSLTRLLSLSSRGRTLPGNVENSESHDVLEDLKGCDAVLYSGTTVALEALMVGKPIIQFDCGDLLSNDPLFEFTNFKWQVNQRDSLRVTIQEIQDLSDIQYSERQQKGRTYVEQYLNPVTEENLAEFLPAASNQGNYYRSKLE
jgi:hypothetical protein